jgi:uncharacterized protein (DUF362 family)
MVDGFLTVSDASFLTRTSRIIQGTGGRPSSFREHPRQKEQPTMTPLHISRRDFLRGSATAAGLAVLGDSAWAAAPAKAVAIARCPSYEPVQVQARMAAMFDQIGGIRRLVQGKTVAVKLNLTGGVGGTFQVVSAERSYQVHPATVLALAHLLNAAGAKRIRFLESGYSHRPYHELLPHAGWDLDAIHAAGGRVEFEDTRNLGLGKRYAELRVPAGGYIFPSYLLNHSYADTDVYVSLAKLKNHATAGVTLCLKNSFGITPNSLYGDDAGSESATSSRGGILHDGRRKAPAGVPAERQPGSPRVPEWRVPHVVADIAGCRPIDLAILDGIESVKGGEGPWVQELARISPGLLIAGRNAVCTDAVAMAVMGYDPQAPAGARPFPGQNHLALAAAKGLGTNDVKRIEVRGLTVAQARSPFGHYLGS